MPKKFFPPKATRETREVSTPSSGEILFDETAKTLYYGDGVTEGGVKLAPKSETVSSAEVIGLIVAATIG